MNDVLLFVFRVLSAVCSLYSILCFFRIILTWIPQFSYGRFSNFLTGICDPYLNNFRGISFLRFGSFDFSPALGLCLLGAASSLFSMLSHGGRISIALIVMMLLEICYSIISSLVIFLVILFAIRLVLLMLNRDTYESGGFLTNQIDYSISPIVYKIAKTFSFGTRLTYKGSLIVSIAVLLAGNFLLRLCLSFIIALFL